MKMDHIADAIFDAFMDAAWRHESGLLGTAHQLQCIRLYSACLCVTSASLR